MASTTPTQELVSLSEVEVYDICADHDDLEAAHRLKLKADANEEEIGILELGMDDRLPFIYRKRIAIYGAVGSNADVINGIYEASDESSISDQIFYAKIDGKHVLEYVKTSKKWVIKPIEHLGTDDSAGFATLEISGRDTPDDHFRNRTRDPDFKSFSVLVDGELGGTEVPLKGEWQTQPEVRVVEQQLLRVGDIVEVSVTHVTSVEGDTPLTQRQPALIQRVLDDANGGKEYACILQPLDEKELRQNLVSEPRVFAEKDVNFDAYHTFYPVGTWVKVKDWRSENFDYGTISKFYPNEDVGGEHIFDYKYDVQLDGSGEITKAVDGVYISKIDFSPRDTSAVFLNGQEVFVNWQNQNKKMLTAKVVGHRFHEGASLYDVVYLGGVEGVEHDVPPERMELKNERKIEQIEPEKNGMTAEELEEMRKTSVMLQLPSSIYGLIVSLSVSPGSKAFVFMMYFPIMTVTWLAQGVLLYKIWSELPSAQDSPLCSTTDFLLLAVLAVFLIGAISPVQDTITEMRVAYYSTEMIAPRLPIDSFKSDWDTSYSKEKLSDASDRTNIARVMLVLAVVCELVIWISVIVVGCAYILSQEGAGNIVQGAVAITFINDVDNMVYEMVVPEFIKIRAIINPFYSLPSFDKDVMAAQDLLLTLFCAMPMLISLVVGIVIGMQHSFCSNITHY